MTSFEEYTMTNGQQDKTYWRSLEQLADAPAFQEKLKAEFPLGANELELKAGPSRRTFLGIIGASMALAGVTSGCIRKPREKILPYTRRPEDLVEGVAQQYASVLRVGASALGVLVTSHQNRPTKIEGNPLHPMSLGGTSAWAQAMVLDLYDPDRSQSPLQSRKEAGWQSLEAQLAELASSIKGSQGSGTALLVENASSPVLNGLITEFQKVAPQAKVYVDDAGSRHAQSTALAALGLSSSQVVLEIDKAEVILSLDSDFLGTEGDVVRNTKLFAQGRKLDTPEATLTRLYSVEPHFSLTGVNADNRLLLRAGEVGDFASALFDELAAKGVRTGDKGGAPNVTGRPWAKWMSAVAADLAANRGRSLIVAGDKQPAWVHGLVVALNEALGNTGTTVRYVPDAEAPAFAGGIDELAQALNSGGVKTLVMLGGNPAYTAPADLAFSQAIGKAAVSVHLSYLVDETSTLATWHIPRSHELEAWGDLRASDGTVAIRQPLIAPLFESRSEIEILARLIGKEPARGYELTKNHWQAKIARPDFDRVWNRWLNDGVAGDVVRPNTSTVAFNFAGQAALYKNAQTFAEPTLESLELRFPYSTTLYDGRFANNAWLIELPDTVTKLSWDNAALVAPKTAEKLKLESMDLVSVEVEGRTLEIPVWVTPGVAENVLVIPQGWGRTFEGRVAAGYGFNANLLRSARSPYMLSGAKVSKGKGQYVLATTQDHGRMEGRSIVREATFAEYRKEPTFVEKGELIDRSQQKTLLWRRPYEFENGQQWGMTIDLNSCTGCNACSVACTAENNVSVVGKERVLKGREMHWIRIDRYFTGSVDDPQAVVQPVACVHCENAPCEQVCPVGATVHSPEGLNDMAYNRCIGTRYCANNCPYKVRRFNYFAFAKENDESNPLYAMQKNPNVTVRFRGVIEKCSYCVHRINDARIEAKKAGTGIVPDGRIVPACAQACPADAIVFGDVRNPESRVSQLKATPRNYVLLGELATQPRTSFLAKVRNPNPELV